MGLFDRPKRGEIFNFEERKKQQNLPAIQECMNNYGGDYRSEYCEYFPSYMDPGKVWIIGIETPIYQNCICGYDNSDVFYVIYVGNEKAFCENGNELVVTNAIFREGESFNDRKQNLAGMFEFISGVGSYVTLQMMGDERQLVISCIKGKNRSPVLGVIAEILLESWINGQGFPSSISFEEWETKYQELKHRYGFFSYWRENGYLQKIEEFLRLYSDVMLSKNKHGNEYHDIEDEDEYYSRI